MESSNKAVDSSTSTISPEEMLAQIRTMRAQIPEYTQTTVHRASVLAMIAKLDPNFVNSATTAIGTSDPLQKALETTPQQCIDEATEANRWAQVEDELNALCLGVRNANLTRKHRIGLRALRAYQMTKQFVRVEGHDDLKPHLAEMRRLNRFGKGRRNAGQPEPSPAPAPHTDAM